MRHGTRIRFVALAFAAAFASSPPPAAAGALDSLAFMAGSWAGGGQLDRVEEHWTAPRGGLMVGLNRTLRGGKARAFEFFRIEERDGALVYVAQPGGRAPTEFPAIEVSSKRVVFENRGHDFPQRVIYWVEKPGELHARVEGDVNGKAQGMQWTWASDRLAP